MGKPKLLFAIQTVTYKINRFGLKETLVISAQMIIINMYCCYFI